MQTGRSGDRQEKRAGKTSRVRGEDRGRKASGVAHESPGVGDEEGDCKASEVAENPWGSRQGVGGAVDSPQGTDTSGVTKLPRGDKPPGVTTTGEGAQREDRRGRGGDEPPPTT